MSARERGGLIESVLCVCVCLCVYMLIQEGKREREREGIQSAGLISINDTGDFYGTWMERGMTLRRE